MIEFAPCVCPWCDKILLDTTKEMLRARARAFFAHKPVCPRRPSRQDQMDLWNEANRTVTREFQGVGVPVGTAATVLTNG